MDIVLGISTFAEANYIMVFTLNKVQIFDGEKATIQAQWSPSFKGGRTNKHGFGGNQSYSDPANNKPLNQALMLMETNPQETKIL